MRPLRGVTGHPGACARRAGLLALAVACLLLSACTPSRQQIRIAQQEVARVQSTALDCVREDRCGLASPLRERAASNLAASTEAVPHHHLLLLEAGQDALLSQVHLIRSARQSIDIQSFIFAEDDAGYFVLDELLAAARRGVRVRVLVDQLFSVDDVQLLARLSHAHVNFSMRMYNPTFGEAHTSKAQFVAGILCCFMRFNHRMHNKLLLVDGMIGITGGRNYQNRYFDWDSNFNFRDRDVMVAGPAALDMQRSFNLFWIHPLSVPVEALRDVRRERHRSQARTGPILQPPELVRADRMLDVSAQADSRALIERRLAAQMLPANRVAYLSDRPNKPLARRTSERADVSRQLQTIFSSAEHSILMQTPYLVLSNQAQDKFRELQQRPRPPQVIVSTNSLASTDAFPVYALSHKFKRRYLREFGFQIHEYKPFPASAPIDPSLAGALDAEALGAWASEARRTAMGVPYRRRGPLPLRQAGMRISLHAKSLVIDRRIAVIGTHNFDPRSDRLNTESVVVIEDAAVAEQLARAIEQDILPENSWTIARRPKPVVLSGLNYSLGKVSERLPLFDIWPWRYATSWEINPGCEPLPPRHAGFADCYTPVGDFPEVTLSTKAIYTRILTAFGAGLRPIL
jgi:cardiolipin synthase C